MSTLYTPRMLALAADLACYPMDSDYTHQASERSSVCGSTLTLGLDLGEDGTVCRIGMQVSACAIGQSSAAILAAHARGAKPEEIAASHAALQDWLSGQGDLPSWPGLDALAAAQSRPGRHGALLLPWQAATRALSGMIDLDALPTRRSQR